MNLLAFFYKYFHWKIKLLLSWFAWECLNPFKSYREGNSDYEYIVLMFAYTIICRRYLRVAELYFFSLLSQIFMIILCTFVLKINEVETKNCCFKICEIGFLSQCHRDELGFCIINLIIINSIRKINVIIK